MVGKRFGVAGMAPTDWQKIEAIRVNVLGEVAI